MDILAAFNIAEAAMWATFGVIAAGWGGRVRGMKPRLRRVLALASLLFGVSDLVEARTGAWWKPTGLLAFKGVCLVAILGCAAALWRNRRAWRG